MKASARVKRQNISAAGATWVTSLSWAVPGSRLSMQHLGGDPSWRRCYLAHCNHGNLSFLRPFCVAAWMHSIKRENEVGRARQGESRAGMSWQGGVRYFFFVEIRVRCDVLFSFLRLLCLARYVNGRVRVAATPTRSTCPAAGSLTWSVVKPSWTFGLATPVSLEAKRLFHCRFIGAPRFPKGRCYQISRVMACGSGGDDSEHVIFFLAPVGLNALAPRVQAGQGVSPGPSCLWRGKVGTAVSALGI
jgi:hypothetical protein